MNSSYLFTTTIEPGNLCPNQRAITRPLLFVHNYSVFIFGSILNILAFFVLIQSSLRCHSTFAYLAFLSLSNGILSFFRFAQWAVAFYFKIQVEYYLSTCRFSHFILDSLTHLSLLTLVCVNIDRARTVTKNRPNTKFSKSTFHRVLIIELIIAIILCTYHFHWLIKYGYEDEQKKTVCHADHHRTPNYVYFLTTIYPRFELVTFFCFPLLINTLCTILILRSLRLRMRTAKRFSRASSMTTQSKNNQCLQNLFSCLIPRTSTKSNIYSCFCFQIQCRRHRELRLRIGRTERSIIKYGEENDSIDQPASSSIFTNSPSQDIQQLTSTIINKTQRTRRIRDIHLSAMLIVLNIVYFIFNLPFNLHQTFASIFHRNQNDDCIMIFTQLLFDILQQTYFSTNFFLYVLTNRRFREEFYNTMMKICRRKQEYLLRKRIQQERVGSLSLNPSTGMILNFNGEYQAIPSTNQLNRESLISEIELNEVVPTSQHISKLVLSNELPYEQLS